MIEIVIEIENSQKEKENPQPNRQNVSENMHVSVK